MKVIAFLFLSPKSSRIWDSSLFTRSIATIKKNGNRTTVRFPFMYILRLPDFK
ncbi:hypothetical protein HMPREF9137_2439 [Prevotella denticola F0289]|nr:hypothetical protein HMPREF9137_2439 [Prevotella denticola F0289]